MSEWGLEWAFTILEIWQQNWRWEAERTPGIQNSSDLEGKAAGPRRLRWWYLSRAPLEWIWTLLCCMNVGCSMVEWQKRLYSGGQRGNRIRPRVERKETKTEFSPWVNKLPQTGKCCISGICTTHLGRGILAHSEVGVLRTHKVYNKRRAGREEESEGKEKESSQLGEEPHWNPSLSSKVLDSNGLWHLDKKWEHMPGSGSARL